MIAPLRKPCPNQDEINAKFLQLLPLIRMIARKAFREDTPDRRDDAVQDVIATAFINITQLAAAGRLDEARATPIALYAIKWYRSGRRAGVRQNSKDVMNEHCRYLGRSRVHNAGLAEHIADTWASEATVVDSKYSVPRQVAFRMDFSQWYRNLTCRDQAIVKALAVGDTTGEVSKQFNVSPGRVSQLRRKYEESWYEYIHGDTQEPVETV